MHADQVVQVSVSSSLKPETPGSLVARSELSQRSKPNFVFFLCCCRRMQSVTKEGLSFGDEDVADVKKREKYYKKIFSPLAEHLKIMFKGKISKVCLAPLPYRTRRVPSGRLLRFRQPVG